MTMMPVSLRAVLAFDAVTCALMGTTLSLASAPISALTGLPPRLLGLTGLALLPMAAVIALIAWRPSAAGVWVVVAGNVLWVAASLALLAGPVEPNGLGVALVLAQAGAVAVLAWLERARLSGSDNRRPSGVEGFAS